MAPTTGDPAETTDDAAGRQSPDPASPKRPTRPRQAGCRDKRYDDAAEQVTDAASAADREEFRAAIDELRGDLVAGDKYTIWPGHQRGHGAGAPDPR